MLNFGGQKAELWCEGARRRFGGHDRAEQEFAAQCLWFSSLVSKKENLPAARKALTRAGAREVRVIDMAQGNKVSRILAWEFPGRGAPAPPGGLPAAVTAAGVAMARAPPVSPFGPDIFSFATLIPIVFPPVFPAC